MTEPATERTIDWEEIEAQYRAGALSTRAIGRLHGISKTAIEKRAKKAVPPWTRNLAAKVRERVASKLVASVATAKTEGKAIEQAADIAANVLIQHRRDIARLRLRRDALLVHLDQALKPAAPKKGEKPVAPITAGEHAMILERISRIELRIVTLDRQAWGLNGILGGDAGGGGGGDPAADGSEADDQGPVGTYQIQLPANGR